MDLSFDQMKARFLSLCKRYGLDPPEVEPAYPTDPCDYTDPPRVRINLNQDCERDYQVRHLFGHYLADLHMVEDGKYADVVADVVAKMLEGDRGFQLGSVEKDRAETWKRQHEKDHLMKNTGAIGGRWSYTFNPTSIGTIVHVRCTACEAECDVTDYDCW